MFLADISTHYQSYSHTNNGNSIIDPIFCTFFVNTHESSYDNNSIKPSFHYAISSTNSFSICPTVVSTKRTPHPSSFNGKFFTFSYSKANC
jgi:hypothetical protein